MFEKIKKYYESGVWELRKDYGGGVQDNHRQGLHGGLRKTESRFFIAGSS